MVNEFEINKQIQQKHSTWIQQEGNMSTEINLKIETHIKNGTSNE